METLKWFNVYIERVSYVIIKVRNDLLHNFLIHFYHGEIMDELNIKMGNINFMFNPISWFIKRYYHHL